MKFIILFLLTLLIYYSWIYRFRIKLRLSPSKKNIFRLASHTDRQLKKRWKLYSNKAEALTYLSVVTDQLTLKENLEIQASVQWFINQHKNDPAIKMAGANFLFTRILRSETVDQRTLEKAHESTGHLDQQLFEQLLPHYRDELFYHVAIQIIVYYKLNDFSRSEDILNKVKKEFIFDKFTKSQQKTFHSYEEALQKAMNN